MRFIVDAQLPPAFAAWLRRRGVEARHVFDDAMHQAHDASIARRAAAENAVVVTKDRDFRQIGAAELQVLWIRIGNASNAALIAAVEPIWDDICSQLSAGVRVVEVR